MKETIAAWALDIILFLLHMTPAPLRMRVISLIGWLYGTLPHHQKKAVMRNLSLLHPRPAKELHRVSKKIFINFIITLYDFFYPAGIVVDVPDRDKLEGWRAEFGGLMMLTFHFGHWELGARTLAKWGWPLTAVYQEYQNKKFRRMMEKRRAPGVHFIPVGRGAAHDVRAALRRGDLVAMLGDQAFGEDGIPVTLLGHTIKWARGPIVLAVKEKAPIVVAAILRKAPRHYYTIVFDPLVPQTKSPQEVERLAQEVATKFGILLEKYPTQWYQLDPLALVSKKDEIGSKKTQEPLAESSLR